MLYCLLRAISHVAAVVEVRIVEKKKGKKDLDCCLLLSAIFTDPLELAVLFYCLDLLTPPGFWYSGTTELLSASLQSRSAAPPGFMGRRVVAANCSDA